MADFSRESAKTQAVYYLRRVGPDKIKYERQPFNIVDYGTGQFIEPICDTGLSARTWGDQNTLATAEELLILDTPVSFTGVTEIR